MKSRCCLSTHAIGLGCCLAWVLLLIGCGKTDDAAPKNPEQAASRLEQVFAGTESDVKKSVDTASAAMRKGDYEAAVVSLQVIRAKDGITLEQGLAIHHSAVAMEAKLISAMEAGDPKAKQAYELLKRFKRN